MGDPILNLNNTDNWIDLWTGSYVSGPSITQAVEPIPPVTVPFLLDSHIVAVYVESLTAKPTWNFGGLLDQQISIGLTVGGGVDASLSSKRKLWLDSNTLFILPKLTPEYAIRFIVPKWFTQITFILWVYIGPEGDTTEELIKTLQATANEINAKL